MLNILKILSYRKISGAYRCIYIYYRLEHTYQSCTRFSLNKNRKVNLIRVHVLQNILNLLIDRIQLGA